MDVRSLRYFMAVYQAQSISAAAKQCFVAQPSISSAIQQLEDQLETQLFVRHPKGVAPTEAADKLFPLAKQLSNDLNAIGNLFKTTPVKIPFRLGLIRSLGADRMGQLLKEFVAEVDGMDLTLVQPDEQCDARIITTNYLQPQEHFIPLWQDHYLLAVPETHPLGLKSQLMVEDLANVPFIHRSPCEALDSLNYVLGREQIALDVRARIQTLEYALALTSAGVGCALTPGIPKLLEHEGIRFIPLTDIDLSRTIGLAYNKEKELNDALSSLINLCESKAALN
ncbi:LysR family transcriptional regulator [Litoribacillus peritrichatus]|uniref:LysR family transcriptional regulator n=1 Tax=Litoribacillus peritrichatus TaxID=718191 RepID=A0ABP7M7U2_9GAMM